MAPVPRERRTWLHYWAAELVAWRNFRGMTQGQLGQAINYAESTVAMIETAQRKPKQDFVRRCDEALQTGGALERLKDELVDRELVPDWLDRWRQIEEQSCELNSFEIFVVPGLFQTPEYARAILSAGHTKPLDLEAQVVARLERQEILTREDPPMLVAVVDENAIRRMIGGEKVMHDQLTHLLELAEQPHIRLQIIPHDVGAYAGLTGPFVIATLDGDQVVYQEAALRGHIIEGHVDVAAFKRMWAALRADALPQKASLDLITKVAKQWT
jgi:transcriptional regulator with XRE-family HTH domain